MTAVIRISFTVLITAHCTTYHSFVLVRLFVALYSTVNCLALSSCYLEYAALWWRVSFYYHWRLPCKAITFLAADVLSTKCRLLLDQFHQSVCLWQVGALRKRWEIGYHEKHTARLSEIFLPQLFRRQLLASSQDRQETLHTCYFWQAASAGVQSTAPAHSKCAYAA